MRSRSSSIITSPGRTCRWPRTSQNAAPEGSADGIVAGLYRWAEAPEGPGHRATILFSGTAQAAARTAQAELADPSTPLARAVLDLLGLRAPDPLPHP